MASKRSSGWDQKNETLKKELGITDKDIELFNNNRKSSYIPIIQYSFSF